MLAGLATAPSAHADSAWASTWGYGSYYVSAYPQYTGWARVVPARGTPTITAYRQRVPAWRWTGTGWVQSYAQDFDNAWVQPYAPGWSWAYARRIDTWFAVRTSNLVVVR